LLAEKTIGREARAAAWQRRFGDAQRTSLLVEALPGQPRSFVPAPPEQVVAALAANPQAGQLAWLDFESVPSLALRRALRPISQFARRDRYDLKRFMPVALQPAYAPDEQLYALPEEVDARQVYFNRQHFAEAGIDVRKAGFWFEQPEMTWEALRLADLDLASSPRAGGRLPFHPGQEAAPLELWGWQNGGEWLADGGRRATFTSPENVQALAWLAAHARELAGAGLFPAEAFPGPAREGGASDQVDQHPFVTGRVSVCIESTRFVSALAGVGAGADLGYVELPRRFAGWHLLTATRIWGYALLAGAPDEAWDALRFLVGEDAAIVDADATAARQPRAPSPPPDAPPGTAPAAGRPLWFPAHTGQLAVDERLAGIYRTGSKVLDEAQAHGWEQFRHGHRRPQTVAPEAVWPLVQQARQAVLAGRQAPLEALQDAEHAAQARLDQAWAALKPLS
jgi:multiple sugar transport system substrate-binding protein